MKKRIQYLDIIRGIAIILIVMGHMERGLDEAGITTGYIKILDLVIYSIHLPILFILSGITQGLSNKIESSEFNFKKYILNNFIALYIPYLIFIYLIWFIKMFVFSGNHETSYNDFFKLLYNGKWHFWFLLSLFTIKIIHGILKKYIKNKYINIIFWGFCYLLSAFYNIRIIRYMSYGLFFELGYILKTSGIIEKYIKKSIIVSVIMIFVGVLLFKFENLKINMVMIGIPITILLIIAFRKSENYKALQICGKYSMVIYLLHTIFTSVIRTIFIKLKIENFWLIFGFGTTFSILSCLSIVFIYSKFELLKCLEYLFYPTKKIRAK